MTRHQCTAQYASKPRTLSLAEALSQAGSLRLAQQLNQHKSTQLVAALPCAPTPYTSKQQTPSKLSVRGC
jgi:hypothetical protein